LTQRPGVLIAGHEAVRLAARQALEPEFDIEAEAESARGAIAEARDTRPEICLIGWNLPGNGLDAVRGILAAIPGTSVVVLGESRDPVDLIEAIRAGAIGFVPPDITVAKQSSPARWSAICSASCGRRWTLRIS
jgi:DNA-binding NarL/FixJ family response regulator